VQYSLLTVSLLIGGSVLLSLMFPARGEAEPPKQ
jgi:hypothetical protein